MCKIASPKIKTCWYQQCGNYLGWMFDPSFMYSSSTLYRYFVFCHLCWPWAQRTLNSHTGYQIEPRTYIMCRLCMN